MYIHCHPPFNVKEEEKGYDEEYEISSVLLA